MRKTILFLVLILGFFIDSIAQDTGLSFEVHYPITFSFKDYEPEGNSLDLSNRYYENWGVIGGKFQYQITDNIPFNFGIEYTFDTFQSYGGGNYGQDIKPESFLWNHINAFSKMMFESLPELQLYTTGGLTIYKYGGGATEPNYLGFNVGGGVQYDIFNQIYLISSFSLLKTSKRVISDDNRKEKEKYSLLRIGLGFKL